MTTKKSKEVTFTKTKKVFQIDNFDANKKLVSKEERYDTQNSFKYFIGYNNNVIRLLCVKLLKMAGYAKKFEFNSTMSFKISNK